MKYTLTSKDEFSGTTTTHEFTHDYIHEVLSEIELFLRGAGFYFDGHLDFVEENLDTNTEFTQDPDFSFYGDEFELVPKSSHYFDTERNK